MARLPRVTWLVTGASGGIGRAVALEAARHGAKVLVAARSEAKLEAVAREAGAAGALTPMVADLSLQSETAMVPNPSIIAVARAGAASATAPAIAVVSPPT